MRFRENTRRFLATPNYHKWLMKCIIRIALFFKTNQNEADRIANDVFDDDLFLHICYPLLTLILFSEIQTHWVGKPGKSQTSTPHVPLNIFHQISNAESSKDATSKLSNLFGSLNLHNIANESEKGKCSDVDSMGIGNNDVNETNSAELLNEKDVEVREDILTSLMAMNPDDADDDEIANCQTAEHPLVNKLYNLLMHSTEGGSEEEFQIFLSDYPLHIAVATHNVPEIGRLLDQPDVVNVNKQAPEKYACATPLMWASAVGAFWCNNIILSSPFAVEMNQTDTDGHTALDYLVRS